MMKFKYKVTRKMAEILESDDLTATDKFNYICYDYGDRNSEEFVEWRNSVNVFGDVTLPVAEKMVMEMIVGHMDYEVKGGTHLLSFEDLDGTRKYVYKEKNNAIGYTKLTENEIEFIKENEYDPFIFTKEEYDKFISGGRKIFVEKEMI